MDLRDQLGSELMIQIRDGGRMDSHGNRGDFKKRQNFGSILKEESKCFLKD
jgi:hypothetical protein